MCTHCSFFFFSSRRRHTRCSRDWSSDVCSSDLVRSYRARMRAAIARTPADRAAVDWDAVIDDANNGITGDLNIGMDPGVGWDMVWVVQHYLFSSWHQMWQFVVGFADTSGAFDAWLAQPVANRASFLVITPDARFPQGTTRTAQQANSPAVPTGNLYFRNRPASQDVPGNALGVSFYDYYRFQAFFNAQRIGNYPVMTRAEMRLLAAEGYIRKGQITLAGPLIDSSRVAKGNLPPVAGIADL